VGQEQRGFVLNIKRALKLMARAIFVAGANKVNRLHPFVKRNLGALKGGTYGHRELLTAVFALP
jgi:hypothetical protein